MSTYASLNYHFVFSTKNRAPLIQADVRPRLHAYLAGALRELGGVGVSVGGVEDHVHILAGLKPVHCVSDVMQEIKSASSRWVHQELRIREFNWQEGYAAFSVGWREMDAVKEYIANQVAHHKSISHRDEVIELCREAGVEIDMRYFS